MVSLLAKYGANTNDMLSNRWTPLLWAIEKNNDKVVEILINNGANVNAQSIEDKWPLSLAAERGYESIATLLVQNGANVMHFDERLVTQISRESCFCNLA